MLLPVVKYGDPVLRRKGSPVEAVTPDIRALVADMFETMYDSNGVGLAAQQVGRALQVTVIDVREVTDRPSTLWIDDREVDPPALMPLTLINPRLRTSGANETGPEGCLSFPAIYAEITRPSLVDVEALDAEGRPLRFRAGGLLGRAIQHEVDHLNGILFIDRMTNSVRSEVQPEVEKLMARTRAQLAKR
jgi:peptide deformylase